MSTFSSGPWHYVAQIPETFSIEANGEVIAMTALTGEKDEANAKLIAASPALLSVCQRLLNDGDMDDATAVKLLTDVISQATS